MSVMQTLKKRVVDPRQRFKSVLDQLALNSQSSIEQLLIQFDSS
jgi:hypothetical protein